MLKIRGKLVLSFSLVMMILLLTLGSITYLTFKDSIGYNKEHILELSLKNHTLEFDNVLNSLRLNIHSMVEKITYESNAMSPAYLTETLEKQQNSNELIKTIVAIDKNNNMLHGSKNENVLSLIAALTITPDNKEGLSLIEGKVWMSSNLYLPNQTIIRLFYLLDINKLWQTVLNENSREADSLIFVANAENVVLSHIERPSMANETSNKDISTLLQRPSLLNSFIQKLSNNEDELVLVNGYYGIASDLAVMDCRIYSILSTDAYLADIKKLKNRIIAATLITLWFSIWIVLIVAHRLAKPISLLATATLSIQNTNYSAPLNFDKRKDEIGDLATNFEKMRKHITNLIFTDALTGIYNRRYLLDVMENEVSKSMRENLPLAFIMIDLDHFKAINDTYGHGAGDDLLIAAAKAFAKAVRDYDIPARYGGEEFCVMLPATGIEDATIAADRIREAIASLVIHRDNHELRVTCSLGISALGSVENYQTKSKEQVIDALMSYADAALYQSKNNGRNRSTVYSCDS